MQLQLPTTVRASLAHHLRDGDWAKLHAKRVANAAGDREPMTLPMKIGQATEELNLELVASKLDPFDFGIMANQTSFAHGALTATPDGLVFDDNDNVIGLVEMKHTWEGNTVDDLMSAYRPQMQAQLHVCRPHFEHLRFTVFGAIFGNARHGCWLLGPNKAYGDRLVADADDFLAVERTGTVYDRLPWEDEPIVPWFQVTKRFLGRLVHAEPPPCPDF